MFAQSHSSTPLPEAKLFIGGLSFFRFFPVAVFAYSFHTAVLPIYIEMKLRSPLSACRSAHVDK